MAVGAVLAGGRGKRLGGSKATAPLAGRPLISYALAAMAAAGLEAFVVAKPDTELPPLDCEVVVEPAAPTHPLVGIVTALRHAGRPVVVLACDMPLAAPALLAALAGGAAPIATPGSPRAPLEPRPRPGAASASELDIAADEPLVVPAPGGEPEPLQARWSPTLLPALEAALAREEPLRRTVASLSPRLLGDAELAPFGDPATMFANVNDFADLGRTAAMLER